MPVTATSPAGCQSLCAAAPDCVAWVSDPGATQCWLKNTVMPSNQDASFVSGVMNTSLAEPAFLELPLGSLRPHGWMRDWLETQRQGLFGHLQDFWADIENSTWIGGTADGGLHERTPYWLNGMIAVAYLLEDSTMMGVVDDYVDAILARQQPDGWLGPDDSSLGGDAYWARFPLMLALIQYAQFNPSAADRVLNATHAHVRAMQMRMYAVPLGDSWSGARFMDGMLAVQWLLEHDPRGNGQALWDTAELLRTQGFDWETYFTQNLPHGPVPPSQATLLNHGVNVGQALKSGAVKYRHSRDPLDADAARLGQANVFRYHGLPHGVFGSDEHLGGSMPSRGTELCTVVETAFSMSELFRILGDVGFADRAERIVLNALNGELTPSMWAHQYLQQTNQRAADIESVHVWATDGPDAILFGLAPNYGCCTANGPQGLPKFVNRAIFGTADGGVAVAQLTPLAAEISAELLSHWRGGRVGPAPFLPPVRGAPGNVVVNVSGSFPFSDNVTISVTGAPAGMPLHIRIPTWAADARYTVDGGAPQGPPPAGAMLVVPAGAAGEVTVELATRPRIAIETGFNGAASVYRGALMYALPIKESVRVLNRYYGNSTDMAFQNASGWQFALQVDESQPEQSLRFSSRGPVPGVQPWAPDTMPLSIAATVRSLPTWGLELNSSAPPPPSPLVCEGDDLAALRGSAWPCGQPEQVSLVPYAATNLRIGALPWTHP
ncbi:hypothetical protein FNF28_03416 [Cafeteria roenbergensis]|nr:hypothetical protein FNF28_03416 [Cafeteria roenbergensis]